jgi:hypothetical protein
MGRISVLGAACCGVREPDAVAGSFLRSADEFSRAGVGKSIVGDTTGYWEGFAGFAPGGTDCPRLLAGGVVTGRRSDLVDRTAAAGWHRSES